MKSLLFFFFISLSFAFSHSEKKEVTWLGRVDMGWPGGFCWVIGDNKMRPHYVVATNQRDEGHLHEWVAHHLLLGFDGVLVFDDFSKNPVDFLNYLPLEQRKKVLVFLRCQDGGVAQKVVLQQTIANIAADFGVKWSFHLDADEFLALDKRFPSVVSWFKSFPEDVRQVACNWLMYGTGYRENIDSEELMLRAYTYRQKTVFPLVKSAQRPPQPPYPGWITKSPHFMHPPGVSIGAHYAIKGATDGVLVADGVDGEKVVVRSVLGDGGEWEKGPAHTSVGNVNQTCLIVHYYLQSLEDCYKRKIFRPRDDGGEFRASEELKHLLCNHEEYNEVQDKERMSNYAQKIENFLLPPHRRTHLTINDYDLAGFSIDSYVPALGIRDKKEWKRMKMRYSMEKWLMELNERQKMGEGVRE